MLVTVVRFSGRKLRRLRKARGWSGEDVARAACIDRERYFDMEEHSREPGFREGMGLARVLGVPAVDLTTRRRVRVAGD